MRKSAIISVIALAAVAAFAQQQAKFPCVGEKSPTFVLRNIDGAMVSLHLLCGEKIPIAQRKVVVLDFFQVTCKPCIEELPQIKKFYSEWKNNPQVQFYMIGVGETPERVREFQQKYDVAELPVVCDSYLVTSRSFGFNTFPVAMIIDKDRVIRLIVKNRQPNIDEILTTNLNSLVSAP